jgi:hypothetical protein
MKDKIPILLQPQRDDLDQEVRIRDKAAKEKIKEIQIGRENPKIQMFRLETS